MILADTSVWADHLRLSDTRLAELLADGQIIMHAFVLGEIALGFLRQRASILALMQELPAMHMSEPEEVLSLIEGQRLIGAGIGYVDAHLLASSIATPNCQLWTRDKRLLNVASRLGVAALIDH
ncbi:type II toxin-antitoxin system VapC family toxin [Devosia sp.]|uniref:type II toxin-antitoxin system VapC family toxin n=1 Tax=Devosia sp. TaxID=1871048 RepID=UPI003BAC5DB1